MPDLLVVRLEVAGGGDAQAADNGDTRSPAARAAARTRLAAAQTATARVEDDTTGRPWDDRRRETLIPNDRAVGDGRTRTPAVSVMRAGERAAEKIAAARARARGEVLTNPVRSLATSSPGTAGSAFASGAGRARTAAQAAVAAGALAPGQAAALTRALGPAGVAVAGAATLASAARDWLPFLASALGGPSFTTSAIDEAGVAGRALSAVSAGFGSIADAAKVIRAQSLLLGANGATVGTLVDPLQVKTMFQGLQQFHDGIRQRYDSYEATLLGDVLRGMAGGRVGVTRLGF